MVLAIIYRLFTDLVMTEFLILKNLDFYYMRSHHPLVFLSIEQPVPLIDDSTALWVHLEEH